MFKGIFHFSVAVALCAGILFQPVCAGGKSELKMSVSSLADTQTKLTALAEKIDPNLTFILNMSFGQAALWGVDLTKPLGLVGELTDDEEIAYVGFIPVKNQKMFEAQIAQLRENGQLPETFNVKVQDGYSLLLSKMEWEGDIPAFDNSKLLTVKLAPEILAPLLPVLAQWTPDLDVEKAREQIGQMEDVSFSLNVASDLNVKFQYEATAKANTKVAGNFANSEKLSASTLCGFYDENADCSGQFLGTFDENNRSDFVRFMTLNDKFPQELRDALILAMDVKKIDVAYSFNSGEKGISGVYAMGIANGKEINSRIENAIQKMNDKPAEEKVIENSKGKINVRKNKNLNFHEITFNETRVLIAVHAKYLFLAVTSDGSSPYELLSPRLKDLKKGNVKQNVVSNFDMKLFRSAFPNADCDFVGKINYAADCENGKIVCKFTVDNDVFQTIGKLKSLYLGQSGDSDMTDEIFGDDDEDDDDEE